jgi:hypothetical protein
MARKLKTYQTSSGFFDLAVAAPSMKAAAEAWDSRTNVFKQGFAKETRREQAIATAERALQEAKIKKIEKDRAALDRRSQAENARWEKKRVPNDHEVKDEAQRGSCLNLLGHFYYP